MQAHFLRYSCEIFTTKTCYVENKNIRLSIEKMRKRMIAMLRMRMCCCRISGGGSSNRLFTTGGFIIVPPSCTFISRLYFFSIFSSSIFNSFSSISSYSSIILLLHFSYSFFLFHSLLYFFRFSWQFPGKIFKVFFYPVSVFFKKHLIISSSF